MKWCLLAFLFMLIGHAVLSFVRFHKLLTGVKDIPQYIDIKLFGLMLLTGFLAQMVDGSMGMGYGTISTVFLLAIGVPPANATSVYDVASALSEGGTGLAMQGRNVVVWKPNRGVPTGLKKKRHQNNLFGK